MKQHPALSFHSCAGAKSSISEKKYQKSAHSVRYSLDGLGQWEDQSKMPQTDVSGNTFQYLLNIVIIIFTPPHINNSESFFKTWCLICSLGYES